MRAGAHENQVAFGLSINQQPIGIYVALATTGILSDQIVIAVLRIKRLVVGQPVDHRQKILLVAVGGFQLLQVLFEPALEDDVKHHSRGL